MNKEFSMPFKAIFTILTVLSMYFLLVIESMEVGWWSPMANTLTVVMILCSVVVVYLNHSYSFHRHMNACLAVVLAFIHQVTGVNILHLGCRLNRIRRNSGGYIELYNYILSKYDTQYNVEHN